MTNYALVGVVRLVLSGSFPVFETLEDGALASLHLWSEADTSSAQNRVRHGRCPSYLPAATSMKYKEPGAGGRSAVQIFIWFHAISGRTLQRVLGTGLFRIFFFVASEHPGILSILLIFDPNQI